jgi:hypothetical protein
MLKRNACCRTRWRRSTLRLDSQAMEEPPFTPQLFDRPGEGLFYENGRVLGAVDLFAGGVVISEWSSLYPGKGHTKQALQWLREQGFTTIVANGVGTIDDGIGDSATAYWERMLEHGLVDVLLDDHGTDITDWARQRPAALRVPEPRP